MSNTYTFSLTAKDAAGQSATGSGTITSTGGTGDIWTDLDGRQGAPTGTPQYPNVLNGYAPGGRRVRTGDTCDNTRAQGINQPPWMVAGVDYRVGINTGVTLKNPYGSSSLPAGMVQDDANKRFGINNTGTVVEGWDFSSRGYVLELRADNITIQNNRCQYNGTANVAISSASNRPNNVTIQYNEFNGSGAGWDPAAIVLTSMGGKVVIQYNYCIANSWDWVDIGAQQDVGKNSITNFIHKFNFVRGLGSAVGAHPDFFQNVGTCKIDSGSSNFNCAYWQQPPTVQGNWGMGWVAEGNGIITSQLVQYNTVLYPGSPGSNPQSSAMIMSLSNGSKLSGITQNYNYIDASAVAGKKFWGNPVNGYGDASNVLGPNYDMLTGNVIPDPRS